jgi:hypothetical protein
MRLGRAPLIAALTVTGAALVGGCQDYNFNPVGSCVIQPGVKQVKLADVSAADILFVVDDSGSMDPKQQDLANNFDVFIQNLNAFNRDRVARKLEPFEFHIAITTSSIFRNYGRGKVCVAAASSPGGRQCCDLPGGGCTADASCGEATAGQACGGVSGKACIYQGGAYQCCSTQSCTDAGAGCVLGGECGTFSTAYESTLSGGCLAGVATPGAPYSAGDFVRAGANPRVLHFTKSLYAPTEDTAAIQALSAQFKQNIQVGSCGSGGEQHLQSARLAIEKALAGSQPGVAPGEWPHPNAKMVVVFVADEDDCSNPADPNQAIVLQGNPGNDTCTRNQNPVGKPVEYPVSTFESFLSGLGRLLGIGVIASADCSSGTCVPATCQRGGSTYGYAPAKRLLGLSTALKFRGDEAVEGSVCQDFGILLTQIADLVKPPTQLKLPSMPASDVITVLRIVEPSGVQRKVCTQATTDAERAAAGWWFVTCGSTATDPPIAPGGVSTCIHINHLSGNCEANPGETYSAEYLGQLPPGGCPNSTPTAAPSIECARALGVQGQNENAADWWCFGSGGTGTCVCNTAR